MQTLSARRCLSALIVAIIALIFSAGSAVAVAPPSEPGQKLPEHVRQKRMNCMNGGFMVEPVRQAFFAPGEMIGTTILPDYLRTHTDVNVIVLMVQFSDVSFGTSGRTNVTTMVNDLKQYFADQSGSRINIIPTLSNTFTLSHTQAYYGANDDVETLVKDAVAAADSTVNFANYQCVMVAHAGYGDETSGVSGGSDEMWSMYYWMTPTLASTGDGVSVRGATVVPEMEHDGKSALGIICHEFGHQLSLPDLYDTQYTTEGFIGYWSVMSTGSYNGTPRGSSPAFLDPWCRKKLGWVTPTVVSENNPTMTFDFNTTYRLELGGAGTGNDYFFVEKRAKQGRWDIGLPGEGLIVFHVNEAKASSDTPNDSYPGLIEVMVASGNDANGKNHLTISPRSNDRGNANDIFPGLNATYTNFHNTSNPSSKSYSNSNTFIGLRNITRGSSGASMTASAAVYVKPHLAIVSGDSQTASVNTAFAQKLKVNLSDSSGVVANSDVTFTVVGGATISETQPVKTDAQGVAQITLVAGSSAGSVQVNVNASISGTAAKQVSFTETVGTAPSGPVIQTAIFEDVGNDGVNAGDRITLTFNKQIVLGTVAATDFTLPVTGDTLGTNASFAAGTQNSQLVITLGSNPKIIVAGIFNQSAVSLGSPSGINVSASIPAGHISDTSGNKAAAAASAVDVASADTSRPTIVSAVYQDVNGSGVSQGDQIVLTFSKPITFSNVAATDFTLPVSSDSLGSGVSFNAGAQNTQLVISLGSGPFITVAGVFSASATSPGSPSGINISSSIVSGHIRDLMGNDAGPGLVAVDVSTGANPGPEIQSVSYQDTNGNGVVSQGDKLVVTFNKSIVLGSPVASDFLLPVTGDSLGSGAAFALGTINTQLVITLGTGAALTIPGTFSALTLNAGSPSGLNVSPGITGGHITDTSGNNAVSSAAALDIVAAETTGPVLQSATLDDVTGNGVSQGDKLLLTFSKQILIANNASSDFSLPVANDSLGTGATFAIGTQNTQLVVTLGSTPKLTVTGVFSPASITAGSPSGIDVVANIPAGHITDVLGNKAVPAAQPVDIASGAIPTGPTITTAGYEDADNSSTVNQGDKLVLTFTSNIVVNGANAADFSIPVQGDSFGASPAFAAGSQPNQLVVTLGSGAVLVVPGIFNPASTGAGSPSGINISPTMTAGHITDSTGNNAIPAAAAVDIAPSSPQPGDISQTASSIVLKNSSEQPFIADNADTAGVEVTLRDDSSLAIAGCDVWISSSKPGGVENFTPISPAKSDSAGKVLYILKTAQSGVRTLTIEAQKPGFLRKTIGTLQVEFTAGAASKANSTLAADRTLNITADGADSAEITVVLRDANMNAVTGKQVTINPVPTTGVTVTPTTGVTDTGGTARFRIRSTVAQTVTASCVAEGGVVLDKTLTFTFVSPTISTSLSTVVESTPGANYVANGVTYAEIIVTLKNVTGQPVANVIPVATVTGTGNTITPSTLTATDSEGRTYFRITSTVAEKKTVTVKANGLTINNQPQLQFVAGPYSKIIYIGGNNQVGVVGQAATSKLKAQVQDAYGNKVSGQAVRYKVVAFPANASGYSLNPENPSSDVSGNAETIFTYGNKRGEYKVYAELSGAQNSPIIFTCTAQGGSPSTMTIVEGNNQNVPARTLATLPLKVIVYDALGNPLENVVVHFRQTAKPADAIDAIVTQADVTTDATGYARTFVTAGDKIGNYTIAATIGNPATVTANFTLTVIAGNPANLAKVSGDGQIATAGALFAQPFKVKVTDSLGNVVGSPVPGCSVHFFVYRGNGTLSSDVVLTDGNGEALVNYTAGTKAGNEEVRAEVSGNFSVSGSPASFIVSVTPGPAAKLVSGAYYNVLTGLVDSNLTLPFKAMVTDNNGNAVAGTTINFAITGLPPASVAPTTQRIVSKVPSTSVTPLSGIVDCYFHTGERTGTYEITASANDAFGAPLSGSPFKFLAAASSGNLVSGDRTVISISPVDNIVADGADSAEVAITCRDAFDNPISGLSQSYFYLYHYESVNVNNIVEIVPVSTATDVNGVVKTYVRSRKSGTYRISCQINSQPITNVPQVTFVNGALATNVSRFFSTTSLPQVLANGVDLHTVRIELRDANGNPVPGVTASQVNFTNDDPLNTVIYPPAQASDASGYMTFTVSSRMEGNKNIGVSVNGLTVNTSQGQSKLVLNFQTNRVDVSKSTVSVNGSTSATADGSSRVNIKIVPNDSNSAVIEGLSAQAFSVKLKNTSTGSYEQTTVSADVPFVGNDKSYNFYATSTKTGTFEIEAAVIQSQTTNALAQKPSVNFIAGPAAQIYRTSSSDIYSAVGVKTLTPLSVKVTDLFGNPVPFYQVDFAITSTPSGAQNTSIDAGPYLTDMTGVAACSFTLGQKTGIYTFSCTAAGLANSPVAFNVYATPGAASSFTLSVPQTVTQAQNVTQVEMTVYDAYGNVKEDYNGSVYITSSDTTALLPYPSAASAYTFKPEDFGRKIFSEGVIFFTTAASATLTVTAASSVNPIAATSPAIQIAQMQEASKTNFYTGSFFMPGARDYVVVMAKSKVALAEAPKISAAFNDQAANQLVTMNSTSQARVYYTVVRYAGARKAEVKVFGSSPGNTQYYYTQSTFTY